MSTAAPASPLVTITCRDSFSEGTYSIRARIHGRYFSGYHLPSGGWVSAPLPGRDCIPAEWLLIQPAHSKRRRGLDVRAVLTIGGAPLADALPAVPRVEP